MRIAISSVGENLEDNIAEVFGRCPYFIIVDIKEGKANKSEVIKNTGDSRMGGAGVAAAQIVAEKGASVVIAKNVGPRAAEVLKQFKIKVFAGSGTAEEFLRQFIGKK